MISYGRLIVQADASFLLAYFLSLRMFKELESIRKHIKLDS